VYLSILIVFIVFFFIFFFLFPIIRLQQLHHSLARSAVAAPCGGKLWSSRFRSTSAGPRITSRTQPQCVRILNSEIHC
jgi:hypothetical protein